MSFLLLSDETTSEMKESLTRLQPTGVQMETEGLSALSGHRQKSALILVSRVLSLAVEVISVDYEEAEAEEVKAVALVLFVEVRGHLQQRSLLLPKNIIMFQ